LCCRARARAPAIAGTLVFDRFSIFPARRAPRSSRFRTGNIDIATPESSGDHRTYTFSISKRHRLARPTAS